MKFSMRLPRVLQGLLLTMLTAGAAYAADAGVDQTELIARGRYLAKAADCVACHTAPGGKPMAGGLPIDSPFGKIYASNITPSKTHGIGSYTEVQFARAVREGVNVQGQRLYPAMPYTSYAGTTDEDIRALYAYFMHDVEAVDTTPPPTTLAFPFNQRWLMMGWNLLFLDRGPFMPVEGKDAQWNRGKYLVDTLAHCGACHTPRNVLMAEKRSLAFSGGQVGPWRAPNITSDPVSGIGVWSVDDLVQYMRSGAVEGKGQAAGGMAEAIQNSLQYLSTEDLTAIATYLKDSVPVRSSADTRPAFEYGDVDVDFEAGLRAVNTGIGYQAGGPGYPHLTTGAQLYSANCASCHQTTGRGTRGQAFPSLAHNTVLGRDNADNLVNVILDGLHIRVGDEERLMPGFKDALTDAQVAQLAAFVMQQYGNPTVTVDEARVKVLRQGGDDAGAPLRRLMEWSAIAAVIVLALLAAWWKRRRHR
ncbi:cytochrome c [Ralstonia sp. ASV6]|uniref:cytochrome c n=1 Tax=Ralstonia sp. ASV6 TaxID=2795124 RepID=UPI0018ED43C1|nr:cytochrome c [Ralstonia sp. ASV6]